VKFGPAPCNHSLKQLDSLASASLLKVKLIDETTPLYHKKGLKSTYLFGDICHLILRQMSLFFISAIPGDIRHLNP
jgi:hypothetical protein